MKRDDCSMKCACGMEFGPSGKYAFGYHRRECPAFWDSIRAEMESISRKLRGGIAPVSSREWDMHRPRHMPTAKMLRDWAGAWADVQAKIGMGFSAVGRPKKERPQKVAAGVPSIEDFAKMVMRLSEQHYNNGKVIGGNAYDDIRPKGWPQHRTMLKLHGYALDQHGWRQFVFDHIGRTVTSNAEAQTIAAERRMDKIALADGIASGDTEYYEAMNYRVGIPICEATYLRTGRMFVR